VLVNDSTILLADPLGLLNKQLHEHYHNRLSDAKVLTKNSACFKRVPTAAVDRFLELVAHHEIPSGQCCMAYSSTRASSADTISRVCVIAAAGEEELTPYANVRDCFDTWHQYVVVDSIMVQNSYKLLGRTLVAACWGANCVTTNAVSKLTSDSYCLRFIPEPVRQRFIQIIANLVEEHAENQAYLQSKYILLIVHSMFLTKLASICMSFFTNECTCITLCFSAICVS
jgi:hypothetical protein